MTPIFLDNNSTTRLDPDVAAAILKTYQYGYVNPASQHQLGQQARTVLEDTRDELAQLINATTGNVHADKLIFTSGGTESNNLAIRGLVGHPPGHILVSAIEHPSVLATAIQLQQEGFQVSQIPVDNGGTIDLEKLQGLISSNTRLVSVMLANHETGVIQPIQQVSQICRENRVPLHTDATQAVGKIRVDFQELSVSAMTFAAHKFHGPVGIGALVVQHGIELQPIQFGGFQQLGLRPGTENVSLAVGMLEAIRKWKSESVDRLQRMTELRDRFEAALRQSCEPLQINGESSNRLPNTSNIAFMGVNRQSALLAFDMAGVCCSTGSACASGSSEPSPVLRAMGLPAEVIESSIRFGLSATTTADEIDEAVRRITLVIRRLRSNSTNR